MLLLLLLLVLLFALLAAGATGAAAAERDAIKGQLPGARLVSVGGDLGLGSLGCGMLL